MQIAIICVLCLEKATLKKRQMCLDQLPSKRLAARVQKEIFVFPSSIKFILPTSQKKVSFKNYRKTYRKEVQCWATLSCMCDVLSLHVHRNCDLKTIDGKSLIKILHSQNNLECY